MFQALGCWFTKDAHGPMNNAPVTYKFYLRRQCVNKQDIVFVANSMYDTSNNLHRFLIIIPKLCSAIFNPALHSVMIDEIHIVDIFFINQVHGKIRQDPVATFFYFICKLLFGHSFAKTQILCHSAINIPENGK